MSETLAAADIRKELRLLDAHAARKDEREMIQVPISPGSLMGELLTFDPPTGRELLRWLNDGCSKADPFNDEAERIVQEWIDRHG